MMSRLRSVDMFQMLLNTGLRGLLFIEIFQSYT